MNVAVVSPTGGVAGGGGSGSTTPNPSRLGSRPSSFNVGHTGRGASGGQFESSDSRADADNSGDDF